MSKIVVLRNVRVARSCQSSSVPNRSLLVRVVNLRPAGGKWFDLNRVA